jgi:hypothetical protein
VGTNILNGHIHSENLLLDGAALAGDGTLSGALDWSSGQINPGASLTVVTNASLTFSSGVKFTKFIHGSLTNAGTITWQPVGNMVIGGVVRNLAGALFDAQSDNISILTAGSDALIINDGVFRKSAGRSSVRSEVPVINNGTVEIFPGTLEFQGGYTNPTGIILLAGGTFRMTQPFYLAGGLLTGWGTVNADVTNAACIRPSRSDGVLTVNGKLTQLLNGSVEFELAGNTPGTDQSQLNVLGAAKLRGTIGVRLAEGYLPAEGTSFPVMTFASRSGDFTCFNGLILLGQGRRLATLYDATSLTLTTLTAPEPAIIPLRVAAEDSALVCWPAEFVGYQLYYNTNLNQTNWTLIPGVTNRYLEPRPLPPEKYFRLSMP